jgi:hypothetical protein
MMIVGVTRDLPAHEMEQLSLALSFVSCSLSGFGKAESQKHYRQEWLVWLASFWNRLDVLHDVTALRLLTLVLAWFMSWHLKVDAKSAHMSRDKG